MKSPNADARVSLLLGCVLAMAGLMASMTQAAEVIGKPGSPSATTTISGKQLPAPEPEFGGVITDDAGFGVQA